MPRSGRCPTDTLSSRAETVTAECSGENLGEWVRLSPGMGRGAAARCAERTRAPAPSEPERPPLVHLRAVSCGPGGLPSRAGLPPPPQVPAPNEPNPRRRTNPISRAERTQSPAPSEPERTPLVHLCAALCGTGPGCPTSNRLPSTFQRAPYIIVIPGPRVLPIRRGAGPPPRAGRTEAGRPGLKWRRDLDLGRARFRRSADPGRPRWAGRPGIESYISGTFPEQSARDELIMSVGTPPIQIQINAEPWLSKASAPGNIGLDGMAGCVF
jgi:hypothetical protein